MMARLKGGAVELIINWSIIMRFYQSSTGGQPVNLPVPNTIAPSPVEPRTTIKLPPHSPNFFFYFNTYCSQFLDVASQLSQELLRNNTLIAGSVLPHGSKSVEGKKDSQDNSTASRKNASQSNYLDGIPPQNNEEEPPPPPRRRRQEEESSEQYRPEEEYSREANGTRASESKNIPKNYGKAIITFIRKNEDFTRKVLARVGMEWPAFMRNLRGLRANLNTISQLRAMWMQEENDFAKVYRILSLEYLRKHSLEYIFNSRVQNFYKHIKYRYKVIESVSDPNAFTCMKEF